MNKHVERYEFLDPEINLAAFHENAKDRMPVSFEGIYKLIEPNITRLETLSIALKTNQKNYLILKKEQKKVYKIADVERHKMIEEFIDSMMKGSQRRIDSLQEYMAGKDSTMLLLDGKYSELAHLESEYAKKNADVLTNVLEHYGSFIPDSLSRILTHYSNEIKRISSKIEELETTRRNVSTQIKDAARLFHNNRYDTVNFLDFIYYSICVSTTVSFGDIAPNSFGTRLMAVIEILFCILLVGLILEKIKIIVVDQKHV